MAEFLTKKVSELVEAPEITVNDLVPISQDDGAGGYISKHVKLGAMLVGVGQSWTDVTASRADATTYTNSTGRPIFISVSISSGSTAFDVAVGEGYVDGVQVAGSRAVTPVAAVVVITLAWCVPAGSTYKLDGMLSGTITKWSELR